MNLQKQPVEIIFDHSSSSTSYHLLLPGKIVSRHVVRSGRLYACDPITIGGEGAFAHLLCCTVINLYKIVCGGEMSVRPAKALSVEIDKAKSQLLADDINRVMNTIKILLTDEWWYAIKTCFMEFIRIDYCKDFFDQVCMPAKETFGALLCGDLFTGYQYLLGRSSDIINTVKISMAGLDTRKMTSDMCFLRFYANEKSVATVDDILEGLIICSSFGVLQGIY